MTCGEVIACLSRFPPDQTVSIIVLDAGEQLFYEIGAYLLAENKSPALILEVTGAKPFKETKEGASNEHLGNNDTGGI